MYPYFYVFGRQISVYAVMTVIGLVVCGFVASILGKKRKVEYESVILMILAVSLGLFVGAHILFAITRLPEIVALFAEIGNIDAGTFFSELGALVGGMVFYGGFFGAVLAVIIYTRFSKDVCRADALDLLSLSVPLFHVFGRIGCFMTGCCYGVESEFGFASYFNKDPAHYGISRFPVQLAEAAGNLIIFVFIAYLFRKEKLKGKLIFVYMSLYAPMRFILEFFRGDKIRGFLFGVSTSQIISLAIGIFLIIYTSIKVIKRNSNKQNTV